MAANLVGAAVQWVNGLRPAGERWLRKADRVVRRWAGRTRLVAMRSMRSRKGVSVPGSPPTARTKGLKRSIRYARKRPGVWVVGATAGRRRSAVPRALELGGTVRVPAARIRGRRRPAYTARIRKRPYLVPAVRESATQVPAWLRQMK